MSSQDEHIGQSPGSRSELRKLQAEDRRRSNSADALGEDLGEPTYADVKHHGDDYGAYSDYDLDGESLADGRSAAGVSHYSRASRADSRLDRDLKDAIEMVKVSDNKIGALRKMHAQYLLKRVEEALGSGQAVNLGDSRRALGNHGRERGSDSDSETSSLADSAFVYKAQAQQANSRHSHSNSIGDFDRASQRLEKGLGFGSSETESLLSYDLARRGHADSEDVSEVPEEYQASAFNGQDLETGSIFSKDESDEEEDEADKWRKKFKRRVKINTRGCITMGIWVVSLIFYFYVRIAKTMDLGDYLAYGIFVLVVEAMGASATALYGINLLLSPVPPEDYKKFPKEADKVKAPPVTGSQNINAKKRKMQWWRRKAKGKKGKKDAAAEDPEDPDPDKMSVVPSEHSLTASSVQDDAISMSGSSTSGTTAITASAVSLGGIPDLELSYHVRVLIPCYKEDLSIVQATVNAIRDAALPAGCSRTTYLLDDGKDPKKRRWCSKLGDSVVYVSGRKRASDESNGKSGNLNNALSQIYPDGCKIPINEIVCIMDADQVAMPMFFIKTLPMMDDGDDVAMVLSPQLFNNTDVHADIFNHSNIHFWEYMQIGYDALSFISCSGTNFLIRANAFQECGWSPTWTLTEDFALGMELKQRGWQCRYQREYLAIGEAPEQVRNCFQQKSRWCKGHFQVLFDGEHCPIFQHKLSWLQRIMYLQGVWSYVVGAICTPTFIAVPIVTIWAGVFPIVLNFWAAIALTVYYISTSSVLLYVTKWAHLEPLWFSNVGNQIMWFTYVKAFVRGVSSATGAKITFKTTLKGAGLMAGTALGDVWMPFVCWVLLTASLVEGLIKMVTATTVTNTLLISLVWVVWNLIPPTLLLWYWRFGQGRLFTILCKLSYWLSTLLGFAALVLIWLFYPSTYQYGQALSDSHFFFSTQRVGKLPDRAVSWRGDSLLQEYAINFNTKTYDFGGGYMTGGSVGTTKLTMPIAWSTGMVAWGMLDFKEGYQKAGEYEEGLKYLQWSCQYLLKTIIGSAAKPLGAKLIWQVGNTTEDSLYWTRPEDIATARPFYYVSVSLGASDLLGQMVGALAASAAVFKTSQPSLYETLMSWALPLYGVANGQFQGLYLDYLKKPACVTQPNRRSPITPNCSPPYFPLNGSAADTYNSTSYNDDVAWAAMWLYRATGDDGYLTDAKAAFGAYQSSEEATFAESLVVDWNNNYWSTAILLASTTDLDAYHSLAQQFLHDWICSSEQITYTQRGRAWNANKGDFGVTANAVMLATVYGKSISNSNNLNYQTKAKRYICWAKGQVRFMLGDVVDAAVVGFTNPASQTGWVRIGKHGPNQAQDRGASCPNPPASCDFINGLYNPKDNPHEVRGALVEGSSDGIDAWPDVRTRNESRVALENNAGFTAALAGLNMLEKPTWPQCLQGFGAFNKDPVCG